MLVGISGTTGVQIGTHFLKKLYELGVNFELIISEMAQEIIRLETKEEISDLKKLATHVYNNNDLTAPPASGSSKFDTMVIIPCSMKTLSAISQGYANTLISRAADVIIKEGGKLVLVPRESPLSVIHLKNMLFLAKLGVVIAPPIPSFYYHPTSLDELIEHMIGRILDQLGIEVNIKRWNSIYENSKK